MGITISFLCAQSWAGSSKKEDQYCEVSSKKEDQNSDGSSKTEDQNDDESSKKQNENCDELIIRGIKYQREIIKQGLYVPFQLSVDHTTNTLYFTVTDTKKDLADIIACIDLRSGRYEVIPSASPGIATAVDNENRIVYLNFADGVYIYNQTTKDLKQVTGIDNVVRKMFIKDGLYYTVYGSSVLYDYKNGEEKRVNEIPEVITNAFGVDKNGNIWIGNDTNGLYCYIKKENRIVYVGSYFAEEFYSDNDGNLYFTAIDGVFALSDDQSIELLFNEPSVFGLAFDAENNMIYSNNKQIVRLKRADVCSNKKPNM